MRACTEDQGADTQLLPFRLVEQSKVEGSKKVEDTNSAPPRPTFEAANLEGDVVCLWIRPCVDISRMNHGVFGRQALLELAKVRSPGFLFARPAVEAGAEAAKRVGELVWAAKAPASTAFDGASPRKALLSCPTPAIVIDVDGVVKLTRSRYGYGTAGQERREP